MANPTCLSALMFMIVLSFASVAQSSSADCLFTIYVKTKDVQSGGTDAKVTLKLYDKQGYWFEIPDLERFGQSGNHHDYFEAGMMDLFAFRAKCFASNTGVCKIELSHDNTGSHPEWYVDFVEVNMAAPLMLCSRQHFGIHEWLADKPPLKLSVVRDACGALTTEDVISKRISHDVFPLELPNSA